MTKFVPIPADAGGKQRSLAILRRLAERAEVVLCAYDDGSADIAATEKLGVDVRTVPWRPGPAVVARGLARTKSLSAARFWSRGLEAEIQRAAAEAPLDLLQIEYMQMAPFGDGVAARRRVLDLPDVQSSLAASYARARRAPLSVPFHLEAAALRALERRALASFDTVVVVSGHERDRLPGTTGTVMVCPNGIDMPEALPAAQTPTVSFVATMGWAPNTDAALWLGREIWPAVAAAVPGARLLLVGRDPTAAVRALASDSIEVSGTVEDVRPFLAQTAVAVAPLRSGGGTRLKILEALGVGRPVVATSAGVDGLEDLVGRGVVVADDAAGIARALVGLLKAPEAAADMGRVGHDAVAADHSWDGALAPLLEAVSR
ncbi:MAG TPA: glycosyltransferase family 4 protein [Acidimicrobiales bacterium]|nr:glycosyltransferase family 4 protein [Acidimicrobiales bacterium]